MSNWRINKMGIYISWYNFKNEPEDDYNKKYNDVYQNLKKNGLGSKYFKYIFKIMFGNYGLEVVHIWNNSNIIWLTKKNLYLFIWRESSNYKEYGKLKFRCFKYTNTGDCSG